MRPPHQDELPPPFADLREQFRQAAAREIEVERRVSERARRGRSKVVVAVALGLVVPAAGVAGAARVLSDRGGPPADKEVPVADAGVVPSSAVADPDGGPPWALKVFTDSRGRDCLAAARLQGGKLGRVSGGEFIPLPERISGTCGDLGADPVILAADRRPGTPARTLVYGLSRDRSPITIDARGRRQVVRPKALGTFLLVFEGVLPRQSVTVRIRDGERQIDYRIP